LTPDLSPLTVFFQTWAAGVQSVPVLVGSDDPFMAKIALHFADIVVPESSNPHFAILTAKQSIL
jgi:hypothetical protein